LSTTKERRAWSKENKIEVVPPNDDDGPE